MVVTELFDIVLPDVAVSLTARMEDLVRSGVQMSVYARNFISLPWVSVRVSSVRKLGLGKFDVPMNSQEIKNELKPIPGFGLALIEDFLALVGDQRCTYFLSQAIACPGACFTTSCVELGMVTPFVSLGKKTSAHAVGLASEHVKHIPGVAVLLVRL